MCFEVFGADKIALFNIQMGEELTVSFDIDASPWQNRWFNRIRAWKVERVNNMNTTSQTPPAPSITSAPVPAPDHSQLIKIFYDGVLYRTPRTACFYN